METYVIVLGIVCCLIVAALGGVGIWYATRAPKEKKPPLRAPTPTPTPTPQPVAPSMPATAVAIPQAPLQAPVAAPTTMAPAVAAPSACVPDDPAKWDYVRRVDAGGKWVCPSGTLDTGCGWSDGANGEKQCKKPKSVRSKCNPGDPAIFEYVRRWDALNGTWVCPPGTTDTGCSWSDGANGEKQCKRIKGAGARIKGGAGARGPPAPTQCTPDDAGKFDYVRRIDVGGKWMCPLNTIDTGCGWSDGANGEKQCKKPKGAASAASKCAPDDDAKFDYVRRVDAGGGRWVCPPGTADTGCGWSDGANGEKQCKKPKGAGAPSTPAAASKCAPDDAAKFDYVRRVDAGGGRWVCPPGTADTGCSWSDGANGEKQCKKPKGPAAKPNIGKTAVNETKNFTVGAFNAIKGLF